MENSAFIYIPDISGFTKFITETEISHSQHIISELIEIIIEGNELEFNISEIEGDAVLFYKMGDPPSITDVLSQSKNIFIRFHEHLAIIKRDNVCQCGACRSSNNLSLKFISHFGELKEVAIRSFNKILGSDVILAHRLLKNSVSSNEYLLLSEPYLNTQVQYSETELGLLNFIDNIENIENFGEVVTKYLTLSHLKENIKIPMNEENVVEDQENKNKLIVYAPIELVHKTLIDIEAKLNWVPGIKDIKVIDKINRINTKHTCVFDGQSVEFMTLTNKKKKNTIRYSELIELKEGIFFITNYSLVGENDTTIISYSIEPANTDTSDRVIPLSFINRLKQRIMLYVFSRKLNLMIVEFKNYCERLYK